MADKFGIYVSKKKKSNKTLYDELFKKPIKDTGLNETKTDPSIKPGYIHQADLLTMPTDKGFKYALVVVDVGSRLTDSEPIKNKNADTVLNAFKTIYKRDTLSLPKAILQVDSGTEFKSVVKKYFTDNKIYVKYGKPDRHKQQAIVESKNGTIAKGLFKPMYEKEIETGKINTEWVDNLKHIIKLINDNSFKPKQTASKSPVCEGDSCKLLEIGTNVRIILDAPKEYLTGQKLHGKFRATDPRWSTEVYKITDIIVKPNSPPLYLVNGIKNTAFTKNELQVSKS